VGIASCCASPRRPFAACPSRRRSESRRSRRCSRDRRVAGSRAVGAPHGEKSDCVLERQARERDRPPSLAT
jgi:hypothetical protein